MPKLYPPGTDSKTFARMKGAVRADAQQEAFLAHAEGRDPERAAQAYARRERRWRSRFWLVPNMDGFAAPDLLKEGR